LIAVDGQPVPPGSVGGKIPEIKAASYSRK